MKLNFEEASSKEYLLTNGIGSYSSSTVSGANTRRYHGLLVASFNPPTDRLDTEYNRKQMPNADFSKWTSPEAIAITIQQIIQGQETRNVIHL